MDIGSILQRSWEIAWRYKSLWIFGLFIQGLGGFNSAFSPGDSGEFGDFGGFSANFWILMFIAGVIGFIFLIMHFISSAAHIDAVNKLSRGGTYTLGSSFSVGVDNFFRFVGLGLLFLGGLIALVIILALPAVLLFLTSTVLGVVSLLILVPLAIAGIVVLVLVYELAQRPIVIRGSSIGDALDEAYYLFRSQLAECAKFTIVIILISVFVGFGILILLGAIAAPFVAMALASDGNIMIAILLGMPLVLGVMLVINGLYGSFMHSAYTLFYFNLLENQAPVQQEPIGGGPAY